MDERRYGFTLIEMMVAVVIFLLFIGAVYGVYQAASNAMVRTEEHEDVTQTGRVLLGQMTAELACAYQSSSVTTSQLVGEDTDNPVDGVQQDRLTFLTTAHAMADDQPTGDISQVTYCIGGDQEGEQPGLYIEETRHPGLEVDGTQPTRRLLSPLVSGLNCRYLTENGWEDAWTEKTALPIAVRVELTLRGPRKDAKPRVMTATANLMMATQPPAPEGQADAQP